MNDQLRCARYRLSLVSPLIMGIVNVTPDSFSDGGQYHDTSRAVEQAWRMVEEGAHILDIGGASSRPGASPVPVEVELSRVMPVIEALSDMTVPLSIDTSNPAVMRAALDAGVSMINDIRALESPGAIETAAGSDAAVVLMHMQGTPPDMQNDPRYENVVMEVANYLEGRVAAVSAGGISHDRIAIDPGFGFGKLLVHNLTLMRHLEKLCAIGLPIVAGVSRKALYKGCSLRRPDQRLSSSIAGALIAVQNGARIVRVHDVEATRDALAVWSAVRAIA